MRGLGGELVVTSHLSRTHKFIGDKLRLGRRRDGGKFIAWLRRSNYELRHSRSRGWVRFGCRKERLPVATLRSLHFLSPVATNCLASIEIGDIVFGIMFSRLPLYFNNAERTLHLSAKRIITVVKSTRLRTSLRTDAGFEILKVVIVNIIGCDFV
jgi:hypothetical protein